MKDFTGPDRSAALWYSAGRRAAKEEPETVQEAPDSRTADGGDMAVDVWLFGHLWALTTERPLSLSLSRNATIKEMLAALADRLGSEFSGLIMDPANVLLPHCRIFVDGEPVEDVASPISAGRNAAKVELILLKGFEGG